MLKQSDSRAAGKAIEVRGRTRLKGVEKCRIGDLADRERVLVGLDLRTRR